MNTSDSVQISP